MSVFIREALILVIEENTASEWIRTVAAMYGGRILQPYEYGTDEYGYEASCEWHPYHLIQYRTQLNKGLRSFCIV